MSLNVAAQHGDEHTIFIYFKYDIHFDDDIAVIYALRIAEMRRDITAQQKMA